ncbi:hypothetical protein ACSQ67_002049 [Phaseolus vulgaris]
MLERLLAHVFVRFSEENVYKTSADPVLRCTTVCTLPFASPPPATISSSPNVSTVDPTMTTALSAGTPARCWSSRRSGTSPSSSWPPPSSSQRCASGRLRRSDSGSAATRSSAFFIWLSSSLSSEAEFAIPFLTLPIALKVLPGLVLSSNFFGE